MRSEVRELRPAAAATGAILRLNNASANETSPLSREMLDHMIADARVATFIPPDTAFVLAFVQSDTYDGGHFRWFQERLAKFLYIDRIVIAQSHRRHGLGRLLYQDLFERARGLGQTCVTCEVNSLPPNPESDAFHAAMGFKEMGTATVDHGTKSVRYLIRRL
jgi:predicted GNAT superfamily acetyltransferase